MAYCTKCGKELFEGTNYCAYCGAPILAENAKSTDERKQEWAGSVIKCPGCGEELPSLTAICPACGHEINSARVSPSLLAFIRQLNDCDSRIAQEPKTAAVRKGWSSWSDVKKLLWVILNIMTYCIPLVLYLAWPFVKPLFGYGDLNLSPEEEKKAALIENHTFPNERESILEGLIFIKSKIAFLASGKYSLKNAYWMRLWGTKAEQLHEKAEFLLKGDALADDTYRDIISYKEKVEKQVRVKSLIAAAGIAVLGILLIIVLHGILNNDGATDTVETVPETETTVDTTVDTIATYADSAVQSDFAVNAADAESAEITDDEGITVAAETFGETVAETFGETVAETFGETAAETYDETVNAAASEPESSSDNELAELTETVDNATEIIVEANEYLGASEFKWFRSGSYLECVIAVTNNSNDYAVKYPAVRIAAYDDEGHVLGTREQTLSIIYPGQVFYTSFLLFESDSDPQKISIMLLNPDNYRIIPPASLEHATYEQMVGENISVGEHSVTGEIFNPNDYDVDSATYTLIFRDDSGEIIMGGDGFIKQIPAGGSVPFQSTIYTDGGLPENCEVLAYFW